MRLSYYRRPLFLLLAAYAAGIFLFRGRLFDAPRKLPFPLPRAGALVEGRAAEYPASGKSGLRFRLAASSVYGRPLSAGLMVYAPASSGVSFGDRISMLADLEAPRGARAPGGLDWADYLSKRGIAAQARARDLEITGPPGPLLRLARSFRSRALRSFEKGLGPEEAAVMAGMVMGEKRAVPAGLQDAFRDSGAMHLLVASGSNVGFVTAVVYFICGWFGLSRRRSGLLALLLAGFYVLAAGLDPPLVRAYLMLAAGFLALLLKRESGGFQALAAAALIILLAQPRALFDAGFQMSFLAAYGLVIGMSAWRERLKAGGLAGKALQLLAISFFAQLCLYPLLAVYFHRISLVSLLSNMALVPASGAAMALGFLMAVSGGPVFSAAAWGAQRYMTLFIKAVRFFAGLPHAAVSVPEPSALFVAGFLAFAFALLHAPLFGFRSRGLYLTAGLGLSAALLGLVPAPGSGGRYQARLFGGGETRCALVSAPSGLYLVNPGMKGRALAGAVLSSGRRSLDCVLLTSLEKKNYSGLAELAGLVEVRAVLLPPGPRPAELAGLLEKLSRGGVRVAAVWPGERDRPSGLGAGWDGYSPGYSGFSDAVAWELPGFRIAGGGASAERNCGGEPGSLKAESGKTVSMEFEAGDGACGG